MRFTEFVSTNQLGKNVRAISAGPKIDRPRERKCRGGGSHTQREREKKKKDLVCSVTTYKKV